MQGPELGAQCRAVWLRAGTLDRRRAVRVKPGRLFVAIAARGLGQRPVGQGGCAHGPRCPCGPRLSAGKALFGRPIDAGEPATPASRFSSSPASGRRDAGPRSPCTLGRPNCSPRPVRKAAGHQCNFDVPARNSGVIKDVAEKAPRRPGAAADDLIAHKRFHSLFLGGLFVEPRRSGSPVVARRNRERCLVS
jgi:hypothetical protein